MLFFLGGAVPAGAGDWALVISTRSPEEKKMAEAIKQAFPPTLTYKEYSLEESDEKQRQVGEQLKANSPAAAVVVGDLAGQMAKWYLEGRPLVYCDAPKAAKISLTSSPVAGIYHEPDPLDQLAALHALFPDRSRITLLFNPALARLDQKALAEQAAALGLSLELMPVASIKDMPNQLKQALGNTQLLWVCTDPEVLSAHSWQYVTLQSLASKVPIFCGNLDLAKSGATAALVPDPEDVGAKAAAQAAEAAEGKTPPPGTVIFPKGRVVINQKTASILGVSFSPAQLQGAEVIQ
jgi:ABC-type uncharacterized transport system substrate-binding protein